METIHQPQGNIAFHNRVSLFFNLLKEKAREFLELEEVEVTFNEEEGQVTGYTYTVLPHKHTA